MSHVDCHEQPVDTSSSSASSEAVSLLDCFDEGLDTVVYSMAECKAVERGSVDGNEVLIEVEDVKNAVDQFFTALLDLVASGVSRNPWEHRSHG